MAITVNAVNDTPNAVNDAVSVTEGSNEVATGNVLVNDTDVDVTDTLSVAGFAAGTPGSPPTGNAGGTVSGTYGDLTINADGSYSYTLGVTGAQQSAIEALGATSANDVFTYTTQDDSGAINDKDTATLTIGVLGTNDAPVTATDSFTVAENDPALVGNVLSNDSDVDGPGLAVTSFTVIAGGSGTAAAGGSIVLASGATLSVSSTGVVTLTQGTSYD